MNKTRRRPRIADALAQLECVGRAGIVPCAPGTGAAAIAIASEPLQPAAGIKPLPCADTSAMGLRADISKGYAIAGADAVAPFVTPSSKISLVSAGPNRRFGGFGRHRVTT
ncbi:MAG: hypothetical protein KBG15_07630 [Kofleriaceae bacterium]|nr:hypothetical protein [Kofleriaceae bacterium]